MYLRYRKPGFRFTISHVTWNHIYHTFRAAERESNPNFLGFYDDYERAKASFTSSVEHGHVYREQRIVRRVKMTMSDEYFGTTCDGVLAFVKGFSIFMANVFPEMNS